MTVEFELSENDLVRSAEHHAQASTVMRRLELFLQIAPAIGLLAIFTYAYRSTPGRAVLLGAATAVIYLLMYRFAGPSLFRGVVRQSLKEGTTAAVIGKHVLVVDEACLRFRSPHSEGQVNWAGVDRVDDALDYVYLYTQPGGGFVVPKRAFRDAEASGAFVARVRHLKGGGV